jgi:hypothetical protein
MTFDDAVVWKRLQSNPGDYYTGAPEPERESFRRQVRAALQTGTVLVEFVKADGSVRQMQCTLNSRYIPVSPEPSPIENNTVQSVDGLDRKSTVKEDPAEPKEESTIRVYDIKAAGWRSFRYDRLRKISATVDFQ